MPKRTVAGVLAFFCAMPTVSAQALTKHTGAGAAQGKQTRSYAPVDADEAAGYGAQANQCYSEAQKLLKQGKNREALRLYSHALLIRQRVWGDADPAVAVLLKQQAELFKQQGQWHECEQNYRKLLAIDVKKFGPGSPELDKPLSDLAEICERQCDSTDALGYYQQLLALRQRYQAPESAAVKTTKLKLAATLAHTCDYKAAEELLKQAIEAEDSSTSPDNPYLIKCLDTYGGVLRETYRTEEAQAIEERQHKLQYLLRHPGATVTTASAVTMARASNSATADLSGAPQSPPEAGK